MEKLYLIIIAFVLGILIYTILPKFCGCDKVLEGHGDQHELKDKIYHILHSIQYDESESSYTIQSLFPSGESTNMSHDTNPCPVGGSIFDAHIETIRCPTAQYVHPNGPHNLHNTRNLILQLEHYNNNPDLLTREFRFNLDEIDITEVNDDGKQQIANLAKVSTRLIKLHNHLKSGGTWFTRSGPTGAPCTHGVDDNCAWVYLGNEMRRIEAGHFNGLLGGVLHRLRLYQDDPDNPGARDLYLNITGYSAVRNMHSA